MKKAVYILSTLAVMLVVSRFVIRIVDATAQIDNDIGMLVLLLLLVNAVIGWIGWRLCRAHGKKNRCQFRRSRASYCPQQNRVTT